MRHHGWFPLSATDGLRQPAQAVPLPQEPAEWQGLSADCEAPSPAGGCGSGWRWAPLVLPAIIPLALLLVVVWNHPPWPPRLPFAVGDRVSTAAVAEADPTLPHYAQYEYRNAYAPFGAQDIDDDGVQVASAEGCMQLCSEDPVCDCVTLESKTLLCWRRQACRVDQMTGPYNKGYVVFVKMRGDQDPAVAPTTSSPSLDGPLYSALYDRNAYAGFGAAEIDDIDNTTFGSEAECMQRCTADPMCGCVTFERASGRCWRRCNCKPKEMTSPWNEGFTVYMKRGGSALECRPPATTTFAPGAYTAELVWGDEFEDEALDRAKWDVIENGQVYNDELQMYREDGNLAVSEGVLRIVAKCQKFRGYNYTSAKLHSRRLFRAGHRVEARLRMSTGKGTWPAFWLMGNGTDVWPRIGEIDILEYTSCSNEVMGNMHYQNRNGEGALNTYKLTADGVQSWHVYRVDWTRDGIGFYLDGRLVGRAGARETYAAWPYNTNEYFIILNLAVGGTLGGSCLRDGDLPVCDQVLDVDWVRVSKLT